MKNTVRFLLLASCSLPSIASGEVVVLHGGRELEGQVTDLGARLRIRHRFGSLTVSKSEVREIRREATLADEYRERAAKIAAGDADAHVALGDWLGGRGWSSQQRKEYEAALAIESEHRGAHTALGHVLHEGRWHTEEQLMELRGFVRLDGRWVTPAEVARVVGEDEREKARRAELRARRELERQLNALVRDIALGSRRKCDRAYIELIGIAREKKIHGLARFAKQARDHYEESWALVRRAQTVRAEVSLTQTRLRRPIRNFTTTLGGGTSPVSFQLPEVSVVSVRTTVTVPAGRGLVGLVRRAPDRRAPR